MTNNHVIGENEAEVTVTVGDRRDVRAKIIGVDSWTDLALLKIEATSLPVIPWGDSSKLKVAEWVMAVGNPFSLNQTVTLGIVSALGRANVGITQYEDFIQTDAAINPGNSGGALINGRGELVGINTAIFSQSGGYQGIGFAVPSNLVRRVIDDLTKFGRVRRGSIGLIEVMPLTSRLADELRAPRTDGVVVNQMHAGIGGVQGRPRARRHHPVVQRHGHRGSLAVRAGDRRQRDRLDRARRDAPRGQPLDAAHSDRSAAGTPRRAGAKRMQTPAPASSDAATHHQPRSRCSRWRSRRSSPRPSRCSPAR